MLLKPHSYRAVEEGIDAHEDMGQQQQRQPLHLELKPRDVWYHTADEDEFGCLTNMKMDKERDHMERIKLYGDQNTVGKVVVTIHDTCYEDSLGSLSGSDWESDDGFD